MLQAVRQPLLEEARLSPTLLSDLAGLEQYVAESYDARSFCELLQNADDANASRFLIERVGNYLFVANDGKEFTQSDFESLCRSAASTKRRGSSIGYRGIGFKSVVSFAQKVYIFSGELAAEFSRERTSQDVPEASRVPLIRIPHPVEPGIYQSLEPTLFQLKQDGFKTVFVFKDLVASGIEAEFNAFETTALLFLRHIRQVAIKATIDEVITARRQTKDPHQQIIRLASSSNFSDWSVIERDGISIAFARNQDEIICLEAQKALVHAFLPTHETVGLPIRINADFSTDPSRTRIVLDGQTDKCIKQVAEVLIKMIDACLQDGSKESTQILRSLIPSSDPRTILFQRKSFKTELFTALQQAACDLFTQLRYCPKWLNSADFVNIAQAANIQVVPRSCMDLEGITQFLRFLGAADASLEELSAGFTRNTLSLIGAAETVSHIVQKYDTKQIASSAIGYKWVLWSVEGKLQSLDRIQQILEPLDQDFIDLLTQKLGTLTQLRRLLIDLTSIEIAAVLLPEKPGQLTHPSVASEAVILDSVPDLKLKRWKRVLDYVLEILQFQGWTVKDVSRQNLGYDLECENCNGEMLYVGVKSLNYVGQPFILTSEEEAIAKQKSSKYCLALVMQETTHVEVAFIQDPIHQLQLERQCRQWVWECSSYKFAAEHFPFE